MSDTEESIWACKIGPADRATLPHGADLPMRQAVQRAYKELTGAEPEFIFSGWAAELTAGEAEVVEDDRAKKLRAV